MTISTFLGQMLLEDIDAVHSYSLPQNLIISPSTQADNFISAPNL